MLNEISFADIVRHIEVKKQVVNPNIRWKVKVGGHRQKNYIVESDDGQKYRMYMRENLNDPKDFSCGLSLLLPSGRYLPLVRCNGSNHRHRDIIYRCHIHRPSIVALQSGRRIDSEAVESDSYNTLEGALATLIAECNIGGIQAKHDEPDLFDAN